MAEISSKPHALLVPSPMMGHLIPLMELASSLVTHHNFHVTVVVVSPNSSPELSKVIQSAKTKKLYDIVELPAPSSGHVSNMAGAVFTNLAALMLDAISSLRSAISVLEVKPAAMIVDIFGTPALTVAEEFHMLKYVMVASCARPLTVLLYAPVLDTQIQGEYLDCEELLEIPGCKAVRPEDVAKPMMNRKDREYGAYLRKANDIASMSDGIMINTWEDLEAKSLKAMREHPEWNKILKVPVYTIGPLFRSAGQSSGGPTTPRSELLDWLDKQPKESVLYVAFGSMGVLSAEQIIEMAWGLELSKQRFIWVVHPPSKRSGDKGNDISEYLPEGFMARTHERGVVVTAWAPQSEILAHSSVGGTLSHCGWNSSVESILNGVPMIAWPLYAEQTMIATQLVEELKVAIKPKELPTKAVAGREEIEMLVKKIMEQKEGDEMRARVKELKASGEKALSKEGSSFNMLSELSRLCKINTEQQGQKV
ncbi:PREDICTED: anthocyanidin 3-O-glucosyltransferase 5-like [Fragaria vesca subsp. vesca]|uniref:anthocyanidin 3-O-glucosyltransferase 5-like n=1 Tax=Fragaria vesca subsp. vesca TaxID=101020 RepID=UPI0002C37612|nr:PREDICTED: anthocyanidin 3-O-glucosyltransferase 5-like [Fragaria vesca subsp. vesca]